MRLSWISPESSLDARRGDVVVCIPVYGGHECFVSCLRSVLAHTSANVPILVCDDASPDPRSAEFVAHLAAQAAESEHRLTYVRRERNVGFPVNVNGAFAMTGPADVVVLNSDCEVAEGWLQGLRAAAYVDSRVATATALTNHGTIVTVPHQGKPSSSLPADWTLDLAAAAVRDASLLLRPRLPTAVGHCVYVRRDALELVGDFDPAFTPGYGEEVDFSQRCLHAGLSHVLADDVLVLHQGGASLSVDGMRNPAQDRNERVLGQRYPYYHAAVQDLLDDRAGPLARALSAARRALVGTSVVMDGRILIGPMTGTQLQVLEVIAALARTGSLHLTVILPDQPGDYARRTLAGIPGVRLVDTTTVAEHGLERADLVHRPYQVGNHEDIAFLAPLGERLIITNQDLIAFSNPSYFSSAGGWQGYRQITRSAMAVADHVVFISAHAQKDALVEDLLDAGRTSVVYNGVDHTLLGSGHVMPAPPPGAGALPADREVMLCLGTDFRHKNRAFALRLLRELRQRHGWSGYLVLAGPHVTHGSSAPEEARWRAANPDVADRVLELSAVSEAGKAWLYERSAVVLYPTVHEGFGLVPFEAADHGRPCMWAPVTSLAEVLPPGAAEIVPWDVERTAARALRLIRDEDARQRNLDAVRTAGGSLTWDRAAMELLRIYRQTCDAPAAPAGAVERRQGLMGGLLSEDAMRLVGPDGALPAELERPLLALATHPQVSSPMFRAIRLGYRAGYVWRRRLQRP